MKELDRSSSILKDVIDRERENGVLLELTSIHIRRARARLYFLEGELDIS